ncbi:MAG: hypothetical protein RL662_531 [Bacteroidota bacterium]|jgi:two-component system OmpR family sensor kinase/two-component system phosphate regulon sensor histidine kinase PhoR
MKLTYKRKLFGLILLIFALFSASIIVLEQQQEKKFRTLALESKLEGYVESIHQYLEQNQIEDTNTVAINKLVNILPNDIRVTIVQENGLVVYDKDIHNLDTLDNHLERPEIKKAYYQDHGTNIRKSTSTQHEYLYYAKFFNTHFIRVALPYTIQTKSLLKADTFFVYFVLVLFIIVLLIVNYVAGRFSKSITELKDFATKIKNDAPLPNKLNFPDDELGELGHELVDIFKQKEKGKNDIEIEREKFVQHFQYSEVGLCMFDAHRKNISWNAHFMQYLNLIVKKPTFDVNCIFGESTFSPILDFLNNRNQSQRYSSFQVDNNGKVFSVQVIIFEDQSFEITIKDITRIIKNRLLKQEMTNNIAHELRTPVTALRGYLETLNDKILPKEKQEQFISRAYQQAVRLSNLIDDISLVSNIDERPANFKMEKINLSELVNEVRIDVADKLEQQHIQFETAIDTRLTIEGNYTLLFSIFRNLIDNSIAYAGSNVKIVIDNYMQDDTYVYLSYYDTGKGVSNEHLNRLFERFYRIHEGRTRNNGGSGLGLSIVKNAILLHKGEIQSKNRVGAGLEFLFTLMK